LLYEVRLTVLIGVELLPILAPITSEPLLALLVADSSTVALVLVLPASIVAVVCNVLALVATKLKSVPAEEGPLIVTVLAALSDM
jgi:hypothetical protein